MPRKTASKRSRGLPDGTKDGDELMDLGGEEENVLEIPALKNLRRSRNLVPAPLNVSRSNSFSEKEDHLCSSPSTGRRARISHADLPTSPSDKARVAYINQSLDDTVNEVTAYMESVVKVFCSHTEPNYSLPWQRKRQFSSTSTGFVISGKRLLTNAHSVEHHTQVKVKRCDSDTKFVAKVLAIGVECDLALLTVEDDAFWSGIQPVKFGTLPRLQDAVLVVGYPIGGDTVSVTSGVVSRIEVTSYTLGATELLGVQIDAAINSGNSGGPVFSAPRGTCVGVAFQSLKHDNAENIGYIIPPPVIEHFILDYERHRTYTGFPQLGIEWQKLENPQLRASLGMKAGEKGVLIRRVDPTAPAFKLLPKGTILMSFDGIAIANDGTVPLRKGERINFSYYVSQKYSNEKAHVEVLQGGKRKKLNITLKTTGRLVPVNLQGTTLPNYFIVAGLVFTPVSVPYLRSEYGKDYDYDAPVKLLDRMMHKLPEFVGEEIVVLSQVLASECNIGYEDIVNTQVLAFNGEPIKTLKRLVELVQKCKDKYLRFDLDYDQVVVLDRSQVEEATSEILTTHCIPNALSEGLRTALKCK